MGHPYLRTIRKHKRERGSALLPVLAMILSASLIVTMIISLSQYDAYTSSAQMDLQRSMYILEGAGNRAQWLISAELSLNPTTSAADFDASQYDYERFLPDGRPHIIDYYGTPVCITISDATSGLDLGTGFITTLNSMRQNHDTDTEYTDKIDRIIAVLTDYTDSGDELSTDGMEYYDYGDLGMEPLPRNAPMAFKEELFYIRELTDIFPPDKYGRLSSIRVIPPPNTQRSSIVPQTTTGGGGNRGRRQSANPFSRNPSIFSVTDSYLKSIWLEDSEILSIREAISRYYSDGTPITDTLDALLFAKIQNRFSWTPSGICTIIVEAPASEQRISRRLGFTLYAAPASGETDYLVKYLDWMFF